MMMWALLIGGPAIFPLAAFYGIHVPGPLSEIFELIGVVTLVLAICALETVGSGSAPVAVRVEDRQRD